MSRDLLLRALSRSRVFARIFAEGCDDPFNVLRAISRVFFVVFVDTTQSSYIFVAVRKWLTWNLHV